jgi:hypothetical protein
LNWNGVIGSNRYCIDEWHRWQQGECFEYAVALTRLRPELMFGTLFDDDERDIHFCAHDATHAYDSAGKHPLPYIGLAAPGRTYLASGAWQDNEISAYDVPNETVVADAMKHAVRHGILDGLWPVPA